MNDEKAEFKENDSFIVSGDNEGAQKDNLEEDDVSRELKKELAEAQEESKNYYDKYLRALAELENTRKRAARDKEEYLKYSSIPLIKRLLPIIDDLERALDTSADNQDYGILKKGLEMIAKNLNQVIEDEGVNSIEALGKPFDPQYHQPLIVEESGEYPENTVIEQMQTGYILNDRVIRPSLVKVSK